MQKKKLAAMILVAMTTNMVSTPISAHTALQNIKAVTNSEKSSDLESTEGESGMLDGIIKYTSTTGSGVEVEDKDDSELDGDEDSEEIGSDGSEETEGETPEEGESIEDAVLEEAPQVLAGEASVKKFQLYGQDILEDYDDVFKVDLNQISSITNNGGKYGSSTLDKAFDGKLSSHFETGKPNSADFKNEIVVTFDEEETLDRIVYAARRDAGGKGFAKEVEIYSSSTDSENDYSLVCTGKYTGSSNDIVEIKFKPTEFKRLKFVFKNADRDWASASELCFYREDSLIDKMNDLFTDSSKYELNEEYRDEDIIDELERLIENHPFRDMYTDDIKLAKELINDDNAYDGVIEAVTKVSEIALSKNINKYNKEYQISTSEYKKVTNNGGHYGQSVLTKLYDGDKSTHWETGRSNSGAFINEVEFTFNSIQAVERIMFTPRQNGGNKGFPVKYEIYGSLDENSDNYKLVAKGGSTSISGSDFEIIFKETKFKKLKFRFVDAYNGWAALSEISFYAKDEVTREVNSVFTDNLYTKLSEEYNSLDKISELERRVNDHPLKDDYMEIIKAAKYILNGDESVASQTMILSQRGDENVQRDERRQIFAGANIDVTGYYVMPGESIEVYLDADPNGILPQVVFAQVGEVDGAGNHRRSLSVGRNIITAPDGTKPYALYFANKALPSQQTYAPIVKFSGESLNTYPVYIHGKTDPAEYIETVKNHTGPNMTDIAGERYLLSCQISEAKIAYVDRGYSPDKTNDDLVKMISLYDKLAGYDVNDENPIHRPSTALYHYKATNAGGLYACNEHIHYSASSARDMLSGKVTGWGFVHEFGHQIENSDMRLLEVTNNIYSTYVQRNFGGNDTDFVGTQNTVDKYHTYNEGTKGFGGFGVKYDFTYGLFERLLVLNQIFEYFGEDVYPIANRLMRENRDKYMSTGSYQSLITALSEATGYDLSSHFEYYNYPVTDATKAFTSQFKPFDKKIRYIAMADYKKKLANVETFNEATKAVIDDVKRESDGFTLSIGTTDHNDAMTAYEIYRDGEFVGFTRTNSYKDTVDASKEYTYEVVAYDYRANESIKSDSISTNTSYRPELRGFDNVTIAINEEFNPLDHIKAFTYNNEAIDSEKINVIRNTVDNTKNGTYEVKYEVMDREIKAEKTLNVTVVSKYDYLSDNQWTSTKTAWGTPRRNSNLKGRVNGEIKNFEKGFGIHANGEIVYHLGEHKYDNFEAFVGVDMTITSQNNSSIKFKIIADGVTLTETGVIKHADNMAYINVPVKGVNELKIEISDAGNGNTSDHGVIVNPILTTNDSKPVINVEDGVSVKLGESLDDVIGSYSANDIEDGDLTNSITVSGAENVNFNKPGKYEITYSVTDSQGNKVNATRTIYVLNMKDYSYLSDVQRKSVSQSWNTLKIDRAVSGNELRLTGENGSAVTYEKGLGTHAASTIVYDLTDKDYQLFTSYVGVDRAMYNSVGSVIFQVFVDGVKMYDSGLMNSKDKQKFVEVDITNASELKLVVTDSGNGNGSDHADWADAKLYSGASKIDRTELDSLISEVESINRADYTELSVVNLESVKEEVVTALMNGYTQGEIDELFTRLSEAKNNLVERVSLERLELKELLKYADTIEKEMVGTTSHPEVTWSNFETYRNIAREALNDKAKTDDELVSVIFTLNYFIEDLKVKTV